MYRFHSIARSVKLWYLQPGLVVEGNALKNGPSDVPTTIIHTEKGATYEKFRFIYCFFFLFKTSISNVLLTLCMWFAQYVCIHPVFVRKTFPLSVGNCAVPTQSEGSERRITKCSIRNHCVVNDLMDDCFMDVPASIIDCQLISFLKSVETRRFLNNWQLFRCEVLRWNALNVYMKY